MSKKEIFVILILVIIAITRFFFFIPKPPDYSKAINKKVKVEGVIISPIDVRLSNEHIIVRPTGSETNILAIIPWGTEVSYGDKVSLTGVLETPEDFITSVGKVFKYKRYLAIQDIYYIINKANIKIISHGNRSKIKLLLFNLRDSFMKNINEVISSPQSDLAGGLILGIRGGFSKKLHNELITTGTIHIVALSGYNVTIVAEGVMLLFGFIFSGIFPILLGILIIILFIVMTGATATAIRAGIMALILLIAKLTGRTYGAGRALVIAGLLMVAYDPRTLINISFQLSFLATVGVLFLTPKVIVWVKFLPMKFKLRELAATTIAASIFVIPILLYTTGILSLVSLPANIFILSVIPLTMFFSFLVGIFGFISPTLALPFAYVAHLLLSYILFIIHFFASLPFSNISTRFFPLPITILIYIFIFWWTFKKEKQKTILS